MVAFIDILPILEPVLCLSMGDYGPSPGQHKNGIGMFITNTLPSLDRRLVSRLSVSSRPSSHHHAYPYVSAQLMGVLGLLLLPVIATIIKTLNDEGTIHIIK